MTQQYASHPAFKPAHADKIQDLGSGYAIKRTLIGYAYGKTQCGSSPQYYWHLYLDGKLIDASAKRGPLVVGARNDAYR